jgi:hypothetical protein
VMGNEFGCQLEVKEWIWLHMGAILVLNRGRHAHTHYASVYSLFGLPASFFTGGGRYFGLPGLLGGYRKLLDEFLKWIWIQIPDERR